MTNKDKSTSFNVSISSKQVEKWNSLKKKGIIVNELISYYLDDRLVKIDLDDDILKKFKEDPNRELIVRKLVASYYRDNILFLDEYKRMLEINNKLSLNVENPIFNNSNKVEFKDSNYNLEDRSNRLENNAISDSNNSSDIKEVTVNENVEEVINENELNKKVDDKEEDLENTEEVREDMQDGNSLKEGDREISDETIPLSRKYGNEGNRDRNRNILFRKNK